MFCQSRPAILVNLRCISTVVFATESGMPRAGDDIMVTGRGLDAWSAIPILGRAAIIGRLLCANKDAHNAYAQMLQSPEHQHPLT
jgi:hypothetical protein